MTNIPVERGYLTESLSSAAHSGEHGFKTVPGLLRLVLEKRAWEERIIIATGEEFPGFPTFEAYIKANPPRGLGAKVEILEKLIDTNEEVRAAFYAALGRPHDEGEITQEQTRCKACGKPIEQTGSPRPRAYCSDACKQKDYRARSKEKKNAVVTPSVDSTHLADLERDLHEARARIEKLEQERDQQPAGLSPAHKMLILDVERLFAYDTEARHIKPWLKKHSVGLPEVGKKLLADTDLPTKRSRSGYEGHMRLHTYSVEEIRAFQDLWRYMLVESIVTTL